MVLAQFKVYKWEKDYNIENELQHLVLKFKNLKKNRILSLQNSISVYRLILN